MKYSRFLPVGTLMAIAAAMPLPTNETINTTTSPASHESTPALSSSTLSNSTLSRNQTENTAFVTYHPESRIYLTSTKSEPLPIPTWVTRPQNFTTITVSELHTVSLAIPVDISSVSTETATITPEPVLRLIEAVDQCGHVTIDGVISENLTAIMCASESNQTQEANDGSLYRLKVAALVLCISITVQSFAFTAYGAVYVELLGPRYDDINNKINRGLDIGAKEILQYFWTLFVGSILLLICFPPCGILVLLIAGLAKGFDEVTRNFFAKYRLAGTLMSMKAGSLVSWARRHQKKSDDEKDQSDTPKRSKLRHAVTHKDIEDFRPVYDSASAREFNYCNPTKSFNTLIPWSGLKDIRDVNHEEETCAICLDDYDKDGVVNLLPCKHFFHTECVQRIRDTRHEMYPPDPYGAMVFERTDLKCPICKLSLLNHYLYYKQKRKDIVKHPYDNKF